MADSAPESGSAPLCTSLLHPQRRPQCQRVAIVIERRLAFPSLLQRGDALHFNAQKPHRVRSVGEVQAQLLVVVHSIEE